MNNEMALFWMLIGSAAAASSSMRLNSSLPLPSNAVPELASTCSFFHTVQQGDTCVTVSRNHSLTLQAFYDLNPQLNRTDCPNLWLGYAYCVGRNGSLRNALSTTEIPTSLQIFTDRLSSPTMVSFATSTVSKATSTVDRTTVAASSPSSSSLVGVDYMGRLTWYDTGRGACGGENGENDAVVAIGWSVFDAAKTSANPNDNPLCGRKIQVSYGERPPMVLEVVDRCTGCGPTDIDVSKQAFARLTALSPEVQGVVTATWHWTS